MKLSEPLERRGAGLAADPPNDHGPRRLTYGTGSDISNAPVPPTTDRLRCPDECGQQNQSKEHTATLLETEDRDDPARPHEQDEDPPFRSAI